MTSNNLVQIREELKPKTFHRKNCKCSDCELKMNETLSNYYDSQDGNLIWIKIREFLLRLKDKNCYCERFEKVKCQFCSDLYELVGNKIMGDLE